jgi:nickel-dependent lactate racemase
MILSYAPGRAIDMQEVEARLGQAIEELDVAGKRVLVIIPDNTRTLPMPTFFETISTHLSSRAREVTFLVALGTHPPLSEDELRIHLGPHVEDFGNVHVVQTSTWCSTSGTTQQLSRKWGQSPVRRWRRSRRGSYPRKFR